MICIQICSGKEWRALKEILNTENSLSYPFGEYIPFSVEGKDCIFYNSGSSKTRSSAACQFAIDNWKPDVIFNLGTCGGVNEKLKKLDLIIANKTVQYDCIIRMGKKSSLFYEPFITEINNSWISLDNFHGTIKEGIIATADQDLNEEFLDLLRAENVLCADWESGAIALVCKLNNIRCCIIRGVTDIPQKGHENSEINQGEDYRTNTPLVMNKLIKIILPFLILSLENKGSYYNINFMKE